MAKKKKTNGIQFPSVLAFERKLSPSDGWFYATAWENRYEEAVPVPVGTKAVRGTISHKEKKTSQGDPSKQGGGDLKDANLQRVDYAALPEDRDTLKVVFTLKAIGGLDEPFVCDSRDFAKKHEVFVAGLDEETYAELARRYVLNLVNGRPLWRNALAAERVETKIAYSKNGERKEFVFDSDRFSKLSFEVPEEYEKEIAELTEAMKEVLSSPRKEAKNVLFEVEIYALMGKGQEVYPSEEIPYETKKKEKKDKKEVEKSKILYSSDGKAAFHSQKIGNAVRTIDTWYPSYATEGFPIAVEPYGQVTSMGDVFRKGDHSFYALYGKAVEGGVLSKEESAYVAACLVRGGVYGGSDE